MPPDLVTTNKNGGKNAQRTDLPRPGAEKRKKRKGVTKGRRKKPGLWGRKQNKGDGGSLNQSKNQ